MRVADQSYFAMPNTFSSTGGRSHTGTVTGLADGSQYTRFVRCRDVAGNTMSASAAVTFSVESPPPAPTFTVAVTLSPSSGPAPLSGVDVTLTLGGTATGTAPIMIECRPGIGGLVNQSQTTVTYPDFCNGYATPGSYTVKATGSRQDVAAVGTALLTVTDADRDGDGIPDSSDQCPFEPGPAPSGCPPFSAEIQHTDNTRVGEDVFFGILFHPASSSGFLVWDFRCGNGQPPISGSGDLTTNLVVFTSPCVYTAPGTYEATLTGSLNGKPFSDTIMVDIAP
jgi:hypothetical protein